MTDIKPLNRKFRGQTPGRIPKKSQSTLGISYSNYRKPKTKNLERSQREKPSYLQDKNYSGLLRRTMYARRE